MKQFAFAKAFVSFAAICLLGCGLFAQTEVPTDTKPTQTTPSPRVSSETFLPTTTKAWVSIPNSRRLADEFKLTSMGQLSDKPEMKPFVDVVTTQFQEYLDKKNFRLGLTMDDVRNVRTGEICLAGVFEAEGGYSRGSHGIVLLADVAGNLTKADELLKKVSSEMERLGAVKEPMNPVEGVVVTKWKVPRVRDPNLKFSTYQTIFDGWLIATDNENILKDVLQRMKSEGDQQALRRLSDDPTFRAIQDRVHAEGVTPEINWFVEPFGYISLAQAIAAEDRPTKSRNDDYAGMLRQHGFDALRGLGGTVAVNKYDFDVIYRMFAFTAADQNLDRKRKNSLEIFDFRNVENRSLKPMEFVPNEYSSHFALTWNMQKAYGNIGPVVNIFAGPDFFELLEKSFVEDLKISLKDMVSKLGNEINIVSTTRQPIDENSERVAIVIPLVGDEAALNKLFADVKKFYGSGGVVKSENGLEYVEIDLAAQEEEAELEIDVDRFKQFETETEDEKVEEKSHQFFVFKKRCVAIVNKHLVFANDADMLFELNKSSVAKKMSEAEDYHAMELALGLFVNWEIAAARQFGRLDRQLETNYHMFRLGKMAGAQTALARILNEVLRDDDATTEQQREQKIKAGDLPEDFAAVVAPFLGLSGWALETQPDGWLITGGVLKKKPLNEMVQKPNEKERR